MILKDSKLRRSTALIALCSVMSSTGMALPAFNKDGLGFSDATAARIVNDDVLSTSRILRDEKERVIYVSPSSSRIDAGSFRTTGFADCQGFARQYELTYRLPAPSSWKALAQEGPQTPFFDMQFGNWYRIQKYLVELQNTVSSIKQFENDPANQDIIKEKLRLDGLSKFYADEIQKRNSTIKNLEAAILAKSGVLSRLTPGTDAYAKAEAELDKAIADRDEQVPPLETEVGEMEDKKFDVDLDLVTANAEYESRAPLTIEDLQEEQALAATVIDSLNAIARTQWNTNVTTMSSFQNRSIGVASAAYGLWGDEESRLRDILSDDPFFRSYSVARLPVYNLKVQLPETDATAASDITMPAAGEADSADFGVENSIAGFGTNGFGVSNGTEAESETVFTTTDDSGEEVDVRFAAQEVGNGDQGVLSFPVTQSTFCVGKARFEEEKVTVDNIQGTVFDNVEFTTFPVPEQDPDFIGSEVKFTYQFPIVNEPIAVTCEMNIDRFMKYVRRKGSSGFLFWKKSWDETQRTSINESGVDCVVENRGGDNIFDPDANQKRINEIKQGMIQEMAADFVLNYAKSYQIKAVEPAGDIEPGKSKVGEVFGPAMSVLCGGNVYCQATSIVLKGLDELFGSRKGKYSSTDVLKGTIKRSYEESGYTLVPGEAQVKLSVKR